MRALARKKRPATSDAGTIERAAIVVFPITISVVTVPNRSCPGLGPQNRIDDPNGVHDSWIIGSAYTKTDQRQRVWADDGRCVGGTLIRRPILDRHKTVVWRWRVGHIGRRDAYVITFDAVALRQFRTRHICPSLDIRVPYVGGFAQIGRHIRLALFVREVGCSEQGCNLDSKREGGITGVFFPSIFRRDGPVANDICSGAADRRPYFQLTQTI